MLLCEVGERREGMGCWLVGGKGEYAFFDFFFFLNDDTIRTDRRGSRVVIIIVRLGFFCFGKVNIIILLFRRRSLRVWRKYPPPAFLILNDRKKGCR